MVRQILMKAQILPLNGKYYGTKILIEHSGYESEVCVWHATGAPSDRELQSWGITRSQWDTGSMVDDGWGGKMSCREYADSHMETQASLEIAQAIVGALANTKVSHGGA